MARIREIKPEFFLDESLALCSLAARLLFVGLWTLCDREGRLEDRPARIKAQLFPYDGEDVDVDVLLGELAAERRPGGFIVRYEVDGRRFIEVRNFVKHQHAHPKELPSKLPAPPAQPHEEPRPARKRPVRTGKVQAVPEQTGKVPAVPEQKGGSMAPWLHGSMGEERIPAGKPRGDPVPWSKEACDLWIERFGGTAPGGQIGKHFKPLVTKHGWAVVRAAWSAYLRQDLEGRFMSAAKFAGTFGEWFRGQPVPAPIPEPLPPRDPDAFEFFEAMKLKLSGVLSVQAHSTWLRPVYGLLWEKDAPPLPANAVLVLVVPTRQFADQMRFYADPMRSAAAELGRSGLRFRSITHPLEEAAGQ